MSKTKLSPSIIVSLLSAIYLIVIFAPVKYSTELWGINHSNYLEADARATILASSIILAFAIVYLGGKVRVSKAIAATLLYAVIPIALMALFYHLRVRTHFLGDGVLRSREIEVGIKLVPTEPLGFYFNYLTYQIAGPLLKITTAQAMELFSYISGLAYYYAAIFLVKTLFTKYENQLLAFIVLVFSGTAVLFCGYAETYTLLPALIALFFATSFRYLKGTASIYWPLGVYLLMVLFHFMFLFLAPCLLLFAYYEWKKSQRGGTIAALAAIILSIGFMIAIPKFAFLPILDVGGFLVDFTPQHDPYWLFSSQHVLDVLDQILLTAIAGIIIFAGVTPYLQRKLFAEDRRLLFALSALPGTLAFLALLHSKLGYASDWDLFSSGGLIIVITAISFFASVKAAFTRLAQSLLAAACVASFLAFAAVNANFDKAVSRQIDILTLAGAYGAVGFETMGNVMKDIGNVNLAEQMWMRSARIKPHWRVYVNIGQTKLDQNKLDEAEFYLRRAWDLDSTRGVIATDLGMALSRQEKISEGEYYLRKAVALDSSEPGYKHNLAISLATQKKYSEAEVFAREAVNLNPDDPSFLTALGGILARQNKFKEGESYLIQAIKLNPADFDPYVNLAFLYEDSGHKDQGVLVVRQYLASNPRAADFDRVQKFLEAYQKGSSK